MSLTDSFHNNVTVTTPSDYNVTHKATFGLAALLVFVVVVIIVLIARHRCRKQGSRSRPTSDTDSPENDEPPDAEAGYDQPVFVAGSVSKPDGEKWRHLTDDIRRMLKDHMIERGRIRLGDVIGKGEFGCVYVAKLAPREQSDEYCAMSCEKVAVKTLKGKSVTCESVESFLKEGMIMKDFDHPNVLSLIGVAMDEDGIPLIVIPYMQHGSLKKYIMTLSLVFTVRDLLSFGYQVAQGMKYLSDMKFIHRDLATRNCMLDESLVVKVADFGLSRDLFCRDYYASSDRCARLPVRWMAPESLSLARYTSKSDVWSFGVLLWELLTRGSLPYADVGNWDVQSHIVSGSRLPQPDVCPDEVYEVMQQCWSNDATDRPSFGDICDFFEAVLSETQTSKVSNDSDYVNLLASVEAQPSDEIDDSQQAIPRQNSQ